MKYDFHGKNWICRQSCKQISRKQGILVERFLWNIQIWNPSLNSGQWCAIIKRKHIIESAGITKMVNEGNCYY